MTSAPTTAAFYDCATLDPAPLKLRTEEFAARLFWSRDQIFAHQQASLRRMLRHAADNSPYYRETISHLVAADAPLDAYPVTNKSILMKEFDRIVTDPRLTRAMIEEHAGSRNCGQLLLDEYRVIATGGSSGQRGVFVYNRQDWEMMNATLRRWHRLTGAPTGARIVGIGAPSPVHASNRFYAEIRAANQDVPALSVITPLDEIVEALNRYQPHIVATYPSLIRSLAEEQIAGRLRITPVAIRSVAEALSPDVREIAKAVWNVPIINGYTSTEAGGMATECLAHDGLHINEDMMIIEIVDEDYKPVPPGQPGSKILVTTFFSTAIPVIRYEFSDILTAIKGVCACGCQFQRIKDIEGRREEMLYTLTQDGRRIEVHAPRLWFHLVRVPGIRNYQFAQLPGGIAIRIVPDIGHDPQVVKAAVEQVAKAIFADLGVPDGHFEVQIVTEIQRSGTAAKQKLVAG